MLRLIPSRSAALVCTLSQSARTWRINSFSTRLTIDAERLSAWGPAAAMPCSTSSATRASRFAGREAADPPRLLPQDGLGQQVAGQLVAGGQHHGPLDVVLQLADVARPLVAAEHLHGLGLHVRHVAEVLLVVDPQEVPDQQRDVLAALAQAAAGRWSPR